MNNSQSWHDVLPLSLSISVAPILSNVFQERQGFAVPELGGFNIVGRFRSKCRVACLNRFFIVRIAVGLKRKIRDNSNKEETWIFYILRHKTRIRPINPALIAPEIKSIRCGFDGEKRKEAATTRDPETPRITSFLESTTPYSTKPRSVVLLKSTSAKAVGIEGSQESPLGQEAGSLPWTVAPSAAF